MRYGIRPKKSLSQSFLKSRGMAEKIVDALCITKDDLVLEVGPGTGVLTQFLVKKAGKVIVVEKDRRLVQVLSEIFKDTPNIVIQEGDILEGFLGQWPVCGVSAPGRQALSLHQGKGIKLISNLPFSISKRFLYLLVENRDTFPLVVLTLQREVAQRLVGKPDTKLYGTLSVMYHCFSDTEILFPIPPSFFSPRPEVSSLVVRINFVAKYPIDDYDRFFSFVKTCFRERRKMLRKTIGLTGPLERKRAGELSPSDFVALWYKVQGFNGSRFNGLRLESCQP